MLFLMLVSKEGVPYYLNVNRVISFQGWNENQTAITVDVGGERPQIQYANESVEIVAAKIAELWAKG